MNRLWRLSLVVAASLLLVACASPQQGGDINPLDPDSVSQMSADLEDQGYAEQAKALADGVVDADEYDAAYELLRQCVEEKGYGVSDAIVSPLNGTTYEFVYQDNGRKVEEAIADYESCEAQYWYPTSFIYSDTAPQEITEPLKEAIIACMEREGISAESDASSYTELVGGIDASQETLEIGASCAQESAYELYPELKTLAVTLQGEQ